MKISFQTQRLRVKQYSPSLLANAAFLDAVVRCLSGSVVKYLPIHFQHISSRSEAMYFLQKQSSESCLLLVENDECGQLLGFIFLSSYDEQQVHLGYLLAEKAWHQGYAKEMLMGLIEQFSATLNEHQLTLTAGVERGNKVSSGLLNKLGFTISSRNESVNFYELVIKNTL